MNMVPNGQSQCFLLEVSKGGKVPVLNFQMITNIPLSIKFTKKGKKLPRISMDMVLVISQVSITCLTCVFYDLF